MSDFITALAGALESLTEYVLPHAPFLGVTFILLIIGHRLSSRIFTKPRAYRFYGNTPKGKWKWRFFYWGRETLPMQPILLGLLIGLMWKDPENLGWKRAASVAYFASAGACSMMLWAIIKGYTKKKGIVLQLPGESDPPAADERLPYDEMREQVLAHDFGGGEEEQPPLLDPASAVASAEDAYDVPMHSTNPEPLEVDESAPTNPPPAIIPLAAPLPPMRANFPKPSVLQGQRPTTPKPGKR